MQFKIESDKVCLCHCLFYHFNRNNTAATTKKLIFETYGENIVSAAVCEKWFKRFRNGDYDFNEPRSGRPNEIENWKHCSTKTQTLKEFAKQLGVESTVSRHLKTMGMRRKKDGFLINSLQFSWLWISLSFVSHCQAQKKFLVTNSYEWWKGDLFWQS